MATRSGKKSTITMTTSVHTPRSGSASKGDRASSPLSPTRISRLQEKVQLQNLNDRLAAYIDRVRFLEQDNSRLNIQVSTIQESVQKEVVSMKGLYEQELADARKLLDDTAREKAQLQIDIGKLKTENEDLRLKLLRKERDFDASEKHLATAESHIHDLNMKLQVSETERKKLVCDIKDLRDEHNKMGRQLNEAKKQLESETLMRVDLENRCQSLREELQFKQQIYEKEITETKSRKQVEISELDGRLTEEYEAKLQDGLKELREQYEDQMRVNRIEVEILYDTKIDELNRRANMSSADVDSINAQLREARSRASELVSKYSHLEKSNDNLEARVSDLEGQLEEERDGHRIEIMTLKDEIIRLQDLMQDQLQEYQDLMDIKVALDMEISAYRKLLESEETRLSISQTLSSTGGRDTPMRRTPVRGAKRKRTVIEEETSKKDEFQATSRATGDIEIIEECPEGTFIRLENKGTKDLSVGGFQLIRKAGTEETVFKFHRASKIPAGITATVYSSSADMTHEPPSTLVMKNQKWVTNDEITTSLLNNDGEEIAARDSKRSHDTVSHTIEQQFGSMGQSKMLQRSSLSPGQSPDEKCCIQ